MARSYGWTVAVTEKDCVSRLARAVYGWDTLTDGMKEWGHQFNIGLYAKDLKRQRNFRSIYIHLIISI